MQNSTIYYLPADVYKLYKHVRLRVHRKWRVQQSITLCTLVTTEYFNYIRGCLFNSIFCYLPADVYKLHKYVRWRVHRRWRVQQSTTLCTLVTTEYLEYIRGCVYNSIFHYLPAVVYKLYKHVRWRVHKRWKVQQSTTLCTLVTTEYSKYIRGCVYNSTFYYLPANVHKLYKHITSRVHRRWKVQQSTNVVYTGSNGIFQVHARLPVQQHILLSSSRRVEAVQTC